MPSDVTKAYNVIRETVKSRDLDELGISPIDWHAEEKEYGVVAYLQDQLGGEGRQVAGIYNPEDGQFVGSDEYLGDRSLKGIGEVEDNSDLRSTVNQVLESS